MVDKEARARIKINRLLERAGWRFFDDHEGRANIRLEPNVKISQEDIDAFGDDFETSGRGFVDFLLLDRSARPLVVLEAKKEDKNPLDGKEQARKYARNLNVRFVILSNGNLHYFWDLEEGGPETITGFPTQDSFEHRLRFQPDHQKLSREEVGDDYIALTQDPGFKHDPCYQKADTRERYLREKELRILRSYQLRAIHALQKSAGEGKRRFLFEMATGTGKTLISAGVVKLFLRTGNAKRILFLVDRIELERQAYGNFKKYLKNDHQTVIYKQNRDDWQKAEIVVSTIQSLSSQDKYKQLFSPTDFDLVISDEAHRSIGGNARAVFEYFVGYKLGLTATPKDYLKNIDEKELSENDLRAWEKRQLLDTYITFGCQGSEPTFRYSLVDGVGEGVLINPIVADARTEITAQLLSDEGYSVTLKDEEGGESEAIYNHRDFERKFLSEKTNQVFCQTFLEHALRDPLSGEMGKGLVFCVSQNHASKITQTLNQMADQLWPGKYRSDFAVQVTSNIPDAQSFTTSFANNNLNGRTQFLEDYRSGKTRVCVTVGMMTTGYDCQDILNLALMRPVFSPTDFIQMKGRGTRKFTFKYTDHAGQNHSEDKTKFKLFDFFANCEYFEEEFDYDEALKLPAVPGGDIQPGTSTGFVTEGVEVFHPDQIQKITEQQVSPEGMKIDRKFFEEACEALQKDKEVKESVENAAWEKAVAIMLRKYENKPELFLTLEKIRKSQNLDRPLTWREVLERVFGLIPAFKTKDEKMEEECEKFIAIHKPESKYIRHIKNFLKCYLDDEEFRRIIDKKEFTKLNLYPGFTMSEFKALDNWRDFIPGYVKDYVPLSLYI